MVWARIDYRLKALNMSDSELARAVHISPQVVHGWRKRGVPPARYAEIARALGMPAEWLLVEIDTPAVADDQTAMQIGEVIAIMRQLDAIERRDLIEIGYLFLSHHDDRKKNLKR